MEMQSKLEKVKMLGIDICKVTMDQMIDLCEEHIRTKTSILLGVVNVAKAVNSRKNKTLKKSLEDADIVVADGKGIVWLSNLIGDPLPERIAGIDVMQRLFERADRRHYSVYLLGATEDVVTKVVNYVKQNYPGLTVAGYRNGYFQQEQEQEIADQIKASSADMLFVAVPSPKKENFLSKWSTYINVPVCHGVGGSFDVVAGITKRAPVWMQKYGLEWFYRVLQEPRRMWKRYLITNSIFLFLAIKEIVKYRLRLTR